MAQKFPELDRRWTTAFSLKTYLQSISLTAKRTPRSKCPSNCAGRACYLKARSKARSPTWARRCLNFTSKRALFTRRETRRTESSKTGQKKFTMFISQWVSFQITMLQTLKSCRCPTEEKSKLTLTISLMLNREWLTISLNAIILLTLIHTLTSVK